MLGYSDSELAALGGYDLVHYDDLSYISSAHQERKQCDLRFFGYFWNIFSPAVLKTGASGMIAYRFQKKDGEWQWLQTSSRLVYKNSKPDFVICTHRQLMEEEGRDLLGKRTMDFKVNLLKKCIIQRNLMNFYPFRLAILTPDYHRHISPKQISFSSLLTDLHPQLWATPA